MPRSNRNKNKVKNPNNVYHGYRGQILNPKSTPQQRANALQHISALEHGAHQTQNQRNGQALVPSHRSSPYGQAYAAHRSLPQLAPQTSDSTALQAYRPPSNVVQHNQQQPAWSNLQQTQQVDHFRVSHPSFEQDLNVERTRTTTVTEEWRAW